MSIVIALFPLVALISLGYLFKKTNFLKADFWRGADQLNYFVLFPAMLFGSLAFAKIDFEVVTPTLLAMVVTILILSALLWVLKYARNIPSERFGVYMQSHIRYNTYMGLMLMGPLFGPPGVQLFAMIMVVAIPLVNVISVVALTQGKGLNVKQTLISILKNPLIIGCLSGFAFNLTGIELFSGLIELLKIMGAACLTLGLLCIGAGLQFRGFKDALTPLLLNTAGRLIIVPIIAFGIATWMGLTTFETTVLVVFFGLPTATASYILTRMLNGDSELMAAVLTLQTLCFALSFPFIMWLLF